MSFYAELFGVSLGDMPKVRGLEPVRNDYTSGFEAGLLAAVEWMRALPKAEMPTETPDVVSLHYLSALEAAALLEEQIERNRS